MPAASSRPPAHSPVLRLVRDTPDAGSAGERPDGGRDPAPEAAPASAPLPTLLGGPEPAPDLDPAPALDPAAALAQADRAVRADDFRSALAHLARAHRRVTAGPGGDVLLGADAFGTARSGVLLGAPVRSSAGAAEADAALRAAIEARLLDVARRWGERVEATEQHTLGHAVRVADLACAVAERAGAAHGFDADGLLGLRLAALLHDVGKLAVPPDVLNQPGKLDHAAWVLVKHHPVAGAALLADADLPPVVRAVAESHHERWDGRGYPYGIAGARIPLAARLVSVADVYDALTSARTYKRALSHDDALAIMRRDAGTVHDPEVFAWFEAAVADRPASTLSAPAPAPEAADASAGAEAGLAASSQPADAAPPDDLTGLPLRRAFRDTAERILEARRTTGRPVALLVVDVDHFKLVNDTFGHLQGDDVLRLVAGQVRACTRPTDFPARYAGDEFVVLLPGTRLDEARQVAERLRAAVAAVSCARRDGSGAQVGVTLSIGVAAAPAHGETVDALFAAADEALYRAKRAGRNAVAAAGAGSTTGGTTAPALDGFVGRTAEREQLRTLLDRVARGEPQLVVVAGEAGVGKSALVRQLAPDVAVRAGRLLTGRCLEADVRPAFGAWADVVTAAARAELLPRRPWPELVRLVPELARGTALSDGTGDGLASPPPAAPGGAFALLDELEACLTLVAAAGPLVVLLEDVQWADASTWAVLEFLLARLDGQRILLCLTLRPEELDAAADARRARLTRSARCSELPVGRLAAADLEQWLRAAFGGQTPEQALVAHVEAESAGNALFAGLTVRALLADGRLRPADGRWVFDAPSDGAAPVPRPVHDVLARRVARLPRACRDVLAVAAVLGREFDAETLAAAADRPEEEVLDALDAGLEAAVLAPALTAGAPGSSTAMAFAHPLFARVLRGAVNPLRLRRIHARVGRALEQRGEGGAAAVAAHFDRAGCTADAFRTALEAGARAAAVYAADTATELFDIARRHARTARERADVAWRQAAVDEVAGAYARAEAACAELTAPLADGAAELGILPAAHRMRERLRFLRGAPAADVLAECERLLAEAEAASLPDEVVALQVLAARARWRLGDVGSAERELRAALAEAQALGSMPLEAEAAMRLGQCFAEARPAEALPLLRRALEQFTRLGDRYGVLCAHGNIGFASTSACNYAAAEVAHRTVLEMAREIGATQMAGTAGANLGSLLLRAGRAAEARPYFQEAHQTFATLGNDSMRLAVLYNLAHMARDEGDAAGAVELYAATAALAASVGRTDVQAGALAGGGLAELDLGTVRGALQQEVEVRALLYNRDDWWFQGRELCEALEARLGALTDAPAAAAARLIARLEAVEREDQHGAVWLAAECAPLLRAAGQVAEASLHRYLVHARALGFEQLSARLRAA